MAGQLQLFGNVYHTLQIRVVSAIGCRQNLLALNNPDYVEYRYTDIDH